MNISLSVLSFLFATELEPTEKNRFTFRRLAKKIMYFAFFDFASSSLQSNGSRFESKTLSREEMSFRLVRSHPYRSFRGERNVLLPCGKCGYKFEQQFTSEVIQLALIRLGWESRDAAAMILNLTLVAEWRRNQSSVRQQ